MGRRATKTPQNPALGAYCTLLECSVRDIAMAAGVAYPTVWSWLNTRAKRPSGVNLVRLVKALRTIAANREAQGLPSVPPEAITYEGLATQAHILQKETLAPKPLKIKRCQQ